MQLSPYPSHEMQPALPQVEGYEHDAQVAPPVPHRLEVWLEDWRHWGLLERVLSQQPPEHEVAVHTHLPATSARPGPQPQMPPVHVAHEAQAAPPRPHFEVPPLMMQVPVVSQHPLTQVLASQCQGSHPARSAAIAPKRRSRDVMVLGVPKRADF